MASLKRSYTKTTLLDLSAKIMDRLEETDLFQQASCIALYHAAGVELTRRDCAVMGEGGLCLGCKPCHWPNCPFGK